MHEFWTIPRYNKTYIRLQNYTNNIVVGEHGIQPFEVAVVMWLLLLFLLDAFVITSAYP